MTKSTKQLLRDLLPYGMLATKKWLASNGLTTHSLDNAVKSKTLLSLVNGVYTQYTLNINWQGVAASLQRIQASPVHVGGLKAL